MVKVTLMSWTEKPIETIYAAFMNMHNKIQGDLNYIELSKQELESFMEMLMKQPHQTVLEFVNTNWLIEDVSRAFQQQLTRTRHHTVFKAYV
jgi:thymidylate synthase ThyX